MIIKNSMNGLKDIKYFGIFTVISSTEVDTLLILSSQIADSLTLLFSKVIYINSTISHDIIPSLTLITSSITIANNIIARLYNLIINIKKDKKASLSTVLIEDIDKDN
ncbi:3769_t:CDS:2, partial [Entrophospora sp. SA101]